MNKFFLIFLVILELVFTTIAIEPITTGFAIAAGIAAVMKKDPIIRGACSFGSMFCVTETCADYYIPANIEALGYDLRNNLYGQHIAIQSIIPALHNHFRHVQTSKKPLVMSLHGLPGTGKNYVSDFIAKNLYREGLNSQFVHKYSGPIDFPSEKRVWEYQERIKTEIKQAIEKCPRSLFIFDEVDSMPKGVFDTISSLMDHHHNIHGLNFRQAVFIFLSNNGGTEIRDTLHGLYQTKGFTREDTDLHAFENILELVIFNRDGGLKDAKPIEKSLIDHFIPFLPMEQRHVELCIKSEFQRLGEYMTENKKQKVLRDVTFDEYRFAKNGCKKITKKVELYKDDRDYFWAS